MVKPPQKPVVPQPEKEGGVNSPAPPIELPMEKGRSGLGVIPPKSSSRTKMEKRLSNQARLEKTIKIEREETGAFTKFLVLVILVGGGVFGAHRADLIHVEEIKTLARQMGIPLPATMEKVAVVPDPVQKPESALGAAKMEASPSVPQVWDVPSFAFGDEFVFQHEAVNGKGIKIQSGEVRYGVVGMLGEKVRWNVSEQTNLVSSRNPFLGDLEDTLLYRESGRAPSSAPLSGDAMSMFPLKPGAQLQLARAGDGGEGYECTVGEAERIQVKAGAFDTIRVNCKTVGGTRSREEAFNYAPSVGHWVARRTLYKSGEFQRTDTYQLSSFTRVK